MPCKRLQGPTAVLLSLTMGGARYDTAWPRLLSPLAIHQAEAIEAVGGRFVRGAPWSAAVPCRFRAAALPTASHAHVNSGPLEGGKPVVRKRHGTAALQGAPRTKPHLLSRPGSV